MCLLARSRLNTKKDGARAGVQDREKNRPPNISNFFLVSKGFLGLPSPPDDEIVKTLCGVPGSETPPVLEVSAYGLRCLSRRERERVNESVLKRKTRDNHREREKEATPPKGRRFKN